MKRVIGFACIISGLFLIGVGAYSGFELYDRYLISTSAHILNGSYTNDTRNITIYDTEDDKFTASIDGNDYLFRYDGNIYKSINDTPKYLIKFTNEELILYIYPQNEGVIFQKQKN